MRQPLSWPWWPGVAINPKHRCLQLARPADAQINLHDTNIAYSTAGKGPTVLLLHGWMCNRTFWQQQIPLLSQTHQVVAPDFRGHGDSSRGPPRLTLAQLVDDIHNMIDKLSLAPVVLIGHSMGGMVAQLLAVRYGSLFSGMVLVTTIASDSTNRLLSKLIESNERHIGFRPAFEASFDDWLGTDTESSLANWIKSEMLRTDAATALSFVRSYRDFDARSEISGVSLPTLVVGATADRSAIPKESVELSQLVPDAELVIIENSGHFPMLETPKHFSDVVSRFLARHGI